YACRSWEISDTSGARLFINMRSAASVCHEAQLMAGPRGARTRRAPASAERREEEDGSMKGSLRIEPERVNGRVRTAFERTRSAILPGARKPSPAEVCTKAGQTSPTSSMQIDAQHI